ncbi:MAG: SGNH/GDSL hydrolase family protein [Capsulimonadales bacterium]|nr:SGNH/GDSL hydrolase family protein [Capsulimonadales bacterium]
MRRSFLQAAKWLLGIVVAWAGTLSAEAQPPTPVPLTLRNVRRIVCLGDSITQQGENPGGYVRRVRRTLAAAFPEQPIEVLNAGISGHKSNDMLARFRRDVLDRKPDLVTISVGVNDVWHAFRDFARNRNYPEGNLPNGVPPDAFRRNVESMMKLAAEDGVRVVLLAATPIYEDLSSPENTRLAEYNAILKDLAVRHKCPFVDLYNSFRRLIRVYREETGGIDNLLTTDGVHMNAVGNRLMARQLLLALGVAPQTLDAVGQKADEPGR